LTSDDQDLTSGQEKEAQQDRQPVRTPSATTPKVGGFKDLLVWRKGIQLVKEIYKLTKPFPADEKFGLISQMRRAAVSIPSNIAEGQARKTTGEFIQFLSHAEGSLAELDTHLVLAVELGYSNTSQVASATELVSELKRMLNGLRRTLLKTVTSEK
jgi:four helix bundle protein